MPWMITGGANNRWKGQTDYRGALMEPLTIFLVKHLKWIIRLASRFLSKAGNFVSQIHMFIWQVLIWDKLMLPSVRSRLYHLYHQECDKFENYLHIIITSWRAQLQIASKSLLDEKGNLLSFFQFDSNQAQCCSISILWGEAALSK